MTRTSLRSLFILIAAAATLLFFVQVARAAPAGILSASSTGQQAFNDPIVSPGVRSAHEHCFYGNRPVNQTETTESLMDASHTSTWAISSNRTAVWIPCVYENGHLLQPLTSKHILLYYKSIAGTECLPGGTKGVTHEYGWRNTLGGGSFSQNVPASSQGPLVLTLFWRGARDFGVSCFPTVQAYVRLNVGAGPIGHITLGGPVEGVDGADGETTAHGDYWAAHDPGWAQRFLDRCLIPGNACGTNPALAP